MLRLPNGVQGGKKNGPAREAEHGMGAGKKEREPVWTFFECCCLVIQDSGIMI